jgi:hypothetical protein
MAYHRPDPQVHHWLDPVMHCVGTVNHDPLQSNEVHIPTFETELAYDYTDWQLPPIDSWTQ